MLAVTAVRRLKHGHLHKLGLISELDIHTRIHDLTVAIVRLAKVVDVSGISASL